MDFERVIRRLDESRVRQGEDAELDEKGLKKGDWWRLQGRTPWGDKPHAHGGKKKSKSGSMSRKSEFSKLPKEHQRKINSVLKLGYMKSTLRKKKRR